MKRFHVHLRVKSLGDSVRFYSALFGAPPNVSHSDYAKWMLDDLYINFAISARGHESGIDHLGFQVETEDQLKEMHSRLERAEMPIESEQEAACCYARSDKHWSVDPQGIPWESYRNLNTIPTFKDGVVGPPPVKTTNCCGPTTISVKPLAAQCAVPEIKKITP